MNITRLLKWLTYLTAALLFFWLVIMKVISRLAARFGRSTPCPASLSWLVTNRFRLRTLQPVMEWVGIRPGEQVLELGPGPGAFTVEAARRTGHAGKVHAVDIQPQMIARLKQRLRAAGVTNVQTHVAGAERLPLPDRSIDRAFLISVLPEISDRAAALAELRRVLRPGGVLSITAEFTDPDYLFAAENERLLEEHGFKPAGRHGNWWVYTANFTPAAYSPAGARYTVADEPALLRDFDRILPRVRPMLVRRYGEPFVSRVEADAREEFRRLIPQIAYVGGRANPLTFNLVSTAWYVALYRVLQRQGMEIAEVGPLLLEVYRAWMESLPGWLLRLRGRWLFTAPARRRLEHRARWSQERRYPGDWVMAVSAEDGFDLGVDYTECGILKLCREQEATELMPCLCATDYIMCERMGVALRRTTTLAEGGSRCDFRFRPA